MYDIYIYTYLYNIQILSAFVVITWFFDVPSDRPSVCTAGPKVSVHTGGSSADGAKGSWRGDMGVSMAMGRYPQ